jgi:hypothetical protein
MKAPRRTGSGRSRSRGKAGLADMGDMSMARGYTKSVDNFLLGRRSSGDICGDT